MHAIHQAFQCTHRPPSKEIDAKNCEEAKRNKISGRALGSETRNPTSRPLGVGKLVPAEDMAAQAQDSRKTNAHRREHGSLGCELPKPSIDKAEDALHMKNASQGEVPCSFQLQSAPRPLFPEQKRKRTASILSTAQSSLMIFSKD